MSIHPTPSATASAPTTASPFDARTATWVLLLAEFLMLATDVFSDQARARRWLSAPHRELSGTKPIDLLAAPTGASRIRELLEQERKRRNSFSV